MKRNSFRKKYYVPAIVWIRLRVIDILMLLPVSVRLTRSERRDIEVYRNEKIFAKIGKDPTLKKQLAAIRPPAKVRNATVDEQIEIRKKALETLDHENERRLAKEAEFGRPPVVID
jgi:hypothetical protein